MQSDVQRNAINSISWNVVLGPGFTCFFKIGELSPKISLSTQSIWSKFDLISCIKEILPMPNFPLYLLDKGQKSGRLAEKSVF
jgi:hypothetical protein